MKIQEKLTKMDLDQSITMLILAALFALLVTLIKVKELVNDDYLSIFLVPAACCFIFRWMPFRRKKFWVEFLFFHPISLLVVFCWFRLIEKELFATSLIVLAIVTIAELVFSYIVKTEVQNRTPLISSP